MYDINYRKKLANDRICICDDYLVPSYCEKGCDLPTMTPCNYHTNLKCSTPSCKKNITKDALLLTNTWT